MTKISDALVMDYANDYSDEFDLLINAKLPVIIVSNQYNVLDGPLGQMAWISSVNSTFEKLTYYVQKS